MPHSPSRRRALLLLASPLLAAACGPRLHRSSRNDPADPPLYPNETPELRRLINKWADHYDVPRPLVQRVVIRESTHRPEARNGPYYGLMQIHPRTARGMGFRGRDRQLLDADTNLKYAVKYLRGAWLVSDGSYDRAVSWYARGYYYEAKRRGLLQETGLI
ncbi:transglycosylase SLT domain-containing protein [Pseudodonghicola xiamenensis]|nr:lytic transglycosylase domain-containing protein [Pseudodonghicola xiamenensis]